MQSEAGKLLYSKSALKRCTSTEHCTYYYYYYYYYYLEHVPSSKLKSTFSAIRSRTTTQMM